MYVEQLRPLLHATLGSGEFIASSQDILMLLAGRAAGPGDSMNVGPLDSQLLDQLQEESDSDSDVDGSATHSQLLWMPLD